MNRPVSQQFTWKLVVFFVYLMPFALVSLCGWIGSAAEQPANTSRVMLTIDYGDGFQKRFTKIRWHKDMTVLTVMQFAKKHARGIEFEFRGRGKFALLTSIDRQSNEGGDGDNWVYRVNGKLGDRSFSIATLPKGARVLWEFGKYE